MAHQATNQYSAGYAQIGGGLCTNTNAVACGSGANRVVLIMQFRRSDRAIAIQSVTLGGESVAVLGSDLPMQQLSAWSARTFALVNPTVEGTQDLVVTATSSGSNASAITLVCVYDEVDPGADETDLLVASDYDTIPNPVSGSISLSIPSAVGEQVVALLAALSQDVSFSFSESGMTQRFESVGGGLGAASGEADGAATVDVSWTPNNVTTYDLIWAAFGFSLPPPSSVPARHSDISLYHRLRAA